MTFVEYRMYRAAIVSRHRAEQAAELAELDAQYSAIDRTAIKAQRAKNARDARAAYSLEREAQKYLTMWGANPRLFDAGRGYYEARLDTATIAERTEMRRACELSRGAYTYHEGGLLFRVYRVTQIVT